jgi:hypothetical protein
MSARSRSSSPIAPTIARNAAVKQLLEALSSALRTDTEDLGLVGTTTLERAFGQLAFTPAQRAVVEVALAKGKVQSSDAASCSCKNLVTFTDDD